MPKKKELTPPDWAALTGGSGEDKWQDDRLRKFKRIKVTAPAIVQLQDRLAAEGALYRCSRRVLLKHPSAAEWYIGLACFAGKTLQNLQQRAKTDFNLSILPERFVEKMLACPDRVSESDLDAFSNWINTELEQLIDDGLEEDRLAGLHVAMVAGGRIIGQGQNEGGELAVAILKEALLESFGPKSDWGFLPNDGREWRNAGDDLQAALSAPTLLHKPTKTRFEFIPGGNRPDIKVIRGLDEDGPVLLVGEVKGRKDLSNLWESWLPQVAAHMDSWATSYPDAYSGVFMTVFTEEMITGETPNSKEKRRGLKKLHEQKVLDFAINLSLLLTKDEGTSRRFKELFSLVLSQQPKPGR